MGWWLAKVPGRHVAWLLVCGAVAILSGCATQPPPGGLNPPGFFHGLLHGFLILFSLIASIFTEHRIYAFPNAGGWYDFGYFLGACAFLGGGGRGSRR